MITSATYRSYEIVGADRYRVLVRLVDDTTGTSDQWFEASGSTAGEIRDDVSRQIAALNATKARKTTLDGIAQGTNIPVTAPAAPAPTAQQTYFANVARLIRMKQLVDAGGMDPANTEFVALKNTVTSTYQASYATSF